MRVYQVFLVALLSFVFSLAPPKQFGEKLRKETQQDITFTCALCGIAINEIEGFIIEDKSVGEIETYLKNDLCAKLGEPWQGLCDVLVDQVPYIIASIENRNSVGTICVELTLCSKPFEAYGDPVPIPSYTINLDLPPIQRWQTVCSQPVFKAMGQFLVNTVAAVVGTEVETYLGDLGALLNDHYYPYEYAQEILGCSQAMNVPYGWLALFNLGYEVSDACTSIVAQTPDGKILHARNLDFWAGMGFTDTLKNMSFIAQFEKGGQTIFKATTFAGYVGVLSGFKNKEFSVTIDTRFYPGGIKELFYEVIAGITEKNASLVTFLARDVMQNENDYDSALSALSKTELIADVYYILAGSSAGQGAVISRNRMNATDVWELDVAAGRWYEVQTNYDHWTQPPWIDDRVDPANKAMDAIGQNNITLQNMFEVLSVKPVFNLQTTYTILSCPADGTYLSWTRYCPYPCVE
eukprot:TRINITY_DN5658_c0_g1_i4.p1 TRINITY_DN5658_c0_g1~~TRINITY_DN5658_c0_g1_i4.p1  ORF type:complete len:465 (-),score=73.54 TRINITY_DN5658_c0_g1_i4:64-1458(-)